MAKVKQTVASVFNRTLEVEILSFTNKKSEFYHLLMAHTNLPLDMSKCGKSSKDSVPSILDSIRANCVIEKNSKHTSSLSIDKQIC